MLPEKDVITIQPQRIQIKPNIAASKPNGVYSQVKAYIYKTESWNKLEGLSTGHGICFFKIWELIWSTVWICSSILCLLKHKSWRRMQKIHHTEETLLVWKIFVRKYLFVCFCDWSSNKSVKKFYSSLCTLKWSSQCISSQLCIVTLKRYLSPEVKVTKAEIPSLRYRPI